MRRCFMLGLLAATSACDDGVHALGTAPVPIATVRGRLTAPISATTHHLRAGLVWAGVPVYIPFCQDNGPNPLDPGRTPTTVGEKGCRDPFEVVPALAGVSVPLSDPSATFELPLTHVPDAAVMVGKLPVRVAYASVIVFDDLNDNGSLDFAPRCGGGSGRGPGSGRMMEEVAPTTGVVEPIYAASFWSLRHEQVRLAYVEGEFDEASFYYPSPSCDVTPPLGFSLWAVGDVLDPHATCRLQSLDAPVLLTPVDPSTLLDLECTQGSRDGFPRPPPSRLPFSTTSSVGSLGPPWQCTPTGGVALTTPSCVCPNLQVFELKGCSGTCSSPEWDVPEPPGWPCHPEGGGS